MNRQFLADKVIGRRNDVDHSRRNIGALGDEPAQSCCVERACPARASERPCCRLRAPGPASGGDLEREVPRHDGTDNADRFTPHLARGVDPGHRYDGIPERWLPRIFVDQVDAGSRKPSANGASSCGP